MTTPSAPVELPPSRWRRLPDSRASMGWQLAHTESLFAGLEAGSPPVVRWYWPKEPALVLGRSQRAERADLAAAGAAGIAVFGRMSGGGAVLIDDHALSLDVALPSSHPLASHDVTHAYRWIGEIWAEALRGLGIAQARAIPTEEVRALPALPAEDPLRLACYGTLSPWEVVVGRRKVVGLSQVRRRAGVVFPIGVHLRWEPERLVDLLAVWPDARPRFTAALCGAAAGLDELTGRPLAAHEVIAAVEEALQLRLGVRLTHSQWLPAEQAMAGRLLSTQSQPHV